MTAVVALSVSGFVQQLAVSYVSNGYFFYVVGSIPPDKYPLTIDAKLIARYGIGVSKWTRARRKRAGEASVQYLRHGRFFVILTTHGRHRFFEEEQAVIRDVRRVPIKCFGYAVSHRRGHVCVRIEREEFKRLKAHFLELAAHRRAETIASEFARLPFEPYAPVRRQLITLWRAVNRVRKTAGFEPAPIECIRMRRRIVKPFGEPAPESEAA